MSQTIDGINKNVIKEFMAEADEIVESINSDLMAISSSEDINEVDPDLINSIFRGAHTLKGISGTFGFKDISHLSHDIEDVLDSIRLGKIPLTEEVLDVLFEGMDFLASLIKDVGKAPPGESISREEEVSTFITNLKNKLSRKKGAAASEEAGERNFYLDKRILNVLTEYEEHRLEENKKKKKNMFLLHAVFRLEIFDEELSNLTDEFKSIGEVISILPSSGEAKEGTIEFDVLTGTNKDKADVKSALSKPADIIDLYKKPKNWDSEESQALEKAAEKEAGARVSEPDKGEEEVTESEESERTVPGEALSQIKAVTDDSFLKSITQTVRVDVSRLDSLMNVVGELVLSKAIIGEITDKLKSMEGFTGIAVDLHKANRVLGRKIDDLQNSVLSIRMIPLNQVFEKMSRMVRKFTRQSGKEIELKIYGADTELDKLIVEDLGDPLMHSIRNSMDHGIELPEVRAQAGKPRTGSVALRASQKGNYVVIEIEDDGKGIEKEKVRKKAIEKNLIKESDDLKDKDIYKLLLVPGFSTRDEVTEISGRGFGMDVVKENVSKLSGMVDIESKEGAGTKITLTLPITLAIIQALIITVSERLYAMPLNSVSEIIKIQPEQIKTIEKNEVIQLREETLPLLRLKDIFILPETKRESKEMFIVVAGFGVKKIGIVVDALKGQQDIVIKSIGDTFKKIKGIAGATDLGNQKTILVLDVGALIEEALQ
jgi:two-component system chemotaxis sensor kinase CheA